VRFKDGAEAESALKRAWEECLQNDMVLLPSLTGPEVAHDRVASTMHHTAPQRSKARAGKAQPAAAPPAAPQSERMVMAASRPPHPIGDDDPTRIMNRAPEEPIAVRAAEVAERKPVPTGDSTITEKDWVRKGYHKTVEESHPYGQGRGMDASSSLSDTKPRGARPRSAVEPVRHPAPAPAGLRDPAARTPPPVRQGVRPRRRAALPARIGLWVAVLLLAVAAGAAGAYLLIGAL
jgi:hypothetical protein